MVGLNFVRIISHVQSCESTVGVSLGVQAVILEVCPKEGINLADSDSIHTLVSKVNPCMSKYKWYTMKL